MPFRSSMGALALGLVLVFANPAQSDQGLVLVVGEPQDPVVQRVERELALMGYDCRIVSGPRRQWARQAREGNVVAVIEVDGDHGEVVLHTAPVLRPRRRPGGYRIHEADERVLALRTAELLHGQLSRPESTAPTDSAAPSRPKSNAPSSKPQGEIRRSSAVRSPPRALGRGGLLAGPALVDAVGGVPPSFAVRAHGVWRPTRWLETGALALLPVSGTELTVPGGETEVRMSAFGASALVLWTTQSLTWGGGAHLLAQRSWHDVTLSTPNRDDTSDAQWAPCLGAQLSAAWRFHSALALRADGLLGAVLPPLEIEEPANPSAVQQARRETVARLGNPVAVVSLGIEVELGASQR